MSDLVRVLRGRVVIVDDKIEKAEKEKRRLTQKPGLPSKASSPAESSSAVSKPADASESASASRPNKSKPAQASSSSSRPSTSPTRRIKVKKESDRDGGPLSLSSPPPSSASQDHDSAHRPADADAMDIDDAPPSRPSRSIAKGKRRQRDEDDYNAADDSQSHARRSSSPSSSEGENDRGSQPVPKRISRQTPAGSSSMRPLGVRLKKNPTLAPSGIAALGAAHRPTGVHPDGLAIQPGGLAPDGLASDFDWSLPEEPASLIPPKPVSRPPKPYPTKPEDVDEDFTAMDWKERERQRDREEALLSTASASASPAPGQTHLHKDAGVGAAIASAAANRVRSQNHTQISYQQYQAYVDGFFKTVTEEDIAWLRRDEDLSHIFEHPPLGRHYSEVWAEEDTPTFLSQYPMASPGWMGAAAGTSSATDPASAGSTAADSTAAKVNGSMAAGPSSSMSHVRAPAGSQAAESGSLTDRVLSMLIPLGPDASDSNGSSNGYGGGEHVNGSANGTDPHPFPPLPRAMPPQDPKVMNANLLEELRRLDLLPPEQEIDWSNPQDDEISALLRLVQKRLAAVMDINKKRRNRVADIITERMAYQDYASCLTSWEKQIEHGWYKRQSQLKKQVSKRKSQRGGAGAGAGVSSGSGSDTSTMPGGAGSSSSKTIPGAAANTSAGAEAALAAGNSSSTSASGANTPNPHSMGDNPSHTLGLPPLPESLVTALQKRAELKRAFEPMFAKMPYANRNPLPDESVFADLEYDEGDDEDDEEMIE